MLSCAVIGCGAAGMAASTALRQSGMLVTCFELSSDPGGIWSSDTRSPFSSRGLISPVYPMMRCVLPKDLMGFSDLRFDFTVPQFPHHSSVRRYLEQFAEKKGVHALTRFNTKVQSVRYDATASVWRVITVNVLNGDVFEWSFDRVCVCTGQTHEPRYPAGLRELLSEYIAAGGELHHASHIKDFRPFRGRRVVVLGDGVTAWDYCSELRRCGAAVVCQSALSPDAVPSAVLGAVRATGAAVSALPLLCRLPGWRGDTSRGCRVVSSWMRTGHAARWPDTARLGSPVGAEGRGIRFIDSARRAEECVAEAKTRALAAERSAGAPNETFLDNVDAVICATGYTRRYPFLHADLRALLEHPPLLLERNDPNHADTSSTSPNATAEGSGALYLGTLLAHCPTLAMVGAQRELLPPWLLFEAQSKFVAYAFTERLGLPNDTSALMMRQRELMTRYPLLRHLESLDGLGLHSAVYYNVLQEELQVGSRSTYTASVMERQKWFLLTGLLRLVHKMRSMAPLKRKKQHILFSNEV